MTDLHLHSLTRRHVVSMQISAFLNTMGLLCIRLAHSEILNKLITFSHYSCLFTIGLSVAK